MRLVLVQLLSGRSYIDQTLKKGYNAVTHSASSGIF